jgi:PAS domain S-box-containing protein
LQLLIVDDQPADAEQIVSELCRAGFAAAWQRVETEPEFAESLGAGFDLILADYALPQFEALRALELLRARGLDVPLIVVTASQGEEAAVECLKQGAADYLLKDRLARLGPAVTHALLGRDLREAKRRADQVQLVLFQIAQAANLTADLPDLLRHIHQQLGTLMDTANFYVALYDEATGLYSFPYVVDEVEAGDSFSPMELRKSLTDYVRRTGAPLLADEAAHRGLIEQGEAELVGAYSPVWLGAPLKTARGVIGVVVVQSYTQSGAYTAKDLDLLAFVSDHLALAIERQRALAAERKQLALAHTLQEVGALLTTRMSLEAVFERLFDLLAGVVAYDSVSVQLLEADGRLSLAAGRGFPDIEQARRYARQMTPQFIEERWARRRVSVIPDTRREPGWISSPGDWPIGSWVGAALVATSRFIGVLNVDSNTPGAYDETAGETVVAFANQAAAAIENARLFQAEREQRELAEALRDSGNVLSTSLNFNAVLDHLLGQIARVVPFDSGSVLLVEGGRTHTARQMGYEQFGAEVAAGIRGLSLEVAGTRSLRRMAETGRPLVIPDTQADPGWVTRPTSAHIRSWAGTPIMADGRAIAFFSLDKATPNFYRPEHAERLGAFAGQAALALENARLFTETQRREIELATLLDVARAVSSSLRLDEVLRLVANSMLRVLGVRVCCLSAYEPEQGQVRTLGLYLASGEAGPAEVGRTYRLADYPLTREVIETGRALVVRADDDQADPAERRLLLDTRNAAMMMAPLRAGERTLGLAELFSDDPHRHFSVGDLRMARALADQAAAAVEHARLFASAQDELAERRRAETALRESEQRFRSLTENSSDITTIVGADGLIHYQSPSIERVLGYLPGDLVGQSLFGYLHPDDLPAVHSAFAEALGQPGLTPLINVRFRHKSGEWRQMEGVGNNRLDDPAVAGIVVNSRDITARKQAEAQLERTARQLAALSHMGQTVAASLELADVLERVAQESLALVGAEGISILLLQDTPDELVFAAVRGAGTPELIGRRVPVASSVAGEALRSGRSLVAVTGDSGPRIYREIEKVSGYHTQALLAVPLRLDDAVIGVMEAVHTQIDAFGRDDLGLLEAAATWAAIAIGNARRHESTRRLLLESEAMAAISRALNQTLDLGRVLKLIVTSAQRVIPKVERAVIHLLDEERRVLRAAAVAGLQTERTAPDYTMRPGEGVAGHAIEFGDVINVADIRSDPRYLPLGRASEMRSLLVAPVASGPRRLGTISVQSASPRAFSADDERLLATLASQAALAMENARFFEIERRRAEEAEALQQVTQTLISRPNLPEMLAAVVEAVANTANYQHVCCYFLEDERGPRLRLQAAQGAPAPEALSLDHGIAGRAVRSGQPLLVRDVRLDREFAEAARGEQSAVAVPLARSGQALGVLLVRSAGGRTLDNHDLNWLMSVGRQLSVALENLSLYADLERALQQEKSTRAQLVQSEKLAAMGRLVASVAHELNNPLQAIQNALYLVERESTLDAQARGDLQVALSEADRMAGLIGRLRESYRPASGEQFGPAALEAVLGEVHRLIATHLRHNGVTFLLEADELAPRAFGIHDQLKQVFLNLCLNAVEAMPGGGQLAVSVRGQPDSGEVLVTVADTGVGIHPAALPNLFDPFYTTKEGGTGLGLPITYDIIQRHNGRIEVKSELGRGSTFHVWLPAWKPGDDHGPSADR